MNKTSDKYWAEYDGLQHAKHKLLNRYLGGWFPILSSWQGRVVYLDCHAGRGRHDTGHVGSPILALKLLLGHQLCRKILASTEIFFIFLENDQENYDALCAELDSLGKLPSNVFVEPACSNYEDEVRGAIEEARAKGQRFAPMFAFVDPYGFSLSMELLNDMLSFPHCELLINFMYRYVDMAIHNTAQAENMNTLFGSTNWVDLVTIQDPNERSDKIIELFSSQLHAEYVTHMYMRGENNVLKYVLFHATNHRRGREVMKDAMWSVTPDGSFIASERHLPDQQILLVPEPDLSPLKNELLSHFSGGGVHMEEIYEWLLGGMYLPKHIHQVIRELRGDEVINASDYEGRFAFSKNPKITFPAN